MHLEESQQRLHLSNSRSFVKHLKQDTVSEQIEKNILICCGKPFSLFSTLKTVLVRLLSDSSQTKLSLHPLCSLSQPNSGYREWDSFFCHLLCSYYSWIKATTLLFGQISIDVSLWGYGIFQFFSKWAKFIEVDYELVLQRTEYGENYLNAKAHDRLRLIFNEKCAQSEFWFYSAKSKSSSSGMTCVVYNSATNISRILTTDGTDVDYYLEVCFNQLFFQHH